MSAPKVIHVLGRARVAYLPGGERIERQEDIFVPSHKQWYRTIDTDNHFCYYNFKNPGTTMLCTCGGAAAVFNYEAYKKFTSINKGQVIACIAHMETGRHADGSS